MGEEDTTCVPMVFLVGMELLLVVWSLEIACDGEDGACELAEASHMEQELALVEVETCSDMEEKLAPP